MTTRTRTKTNPEVLPAEKWLHLAHQHREAMHAHTRPIRERRARGEKHPIQDFLNTYYSLSLGRLERWHPGPDTPLEHHPDALSFFSEKHYRISADTIILDPTRMKEKERTRLTRIHNLLTLTQSRPGTYRCHGLHEWAMVYRAEDIRHREVLPLRLSQEETDRVVETHPICCTHFDAFRHFAPSSQKFNRIHPTLDTREENEQPGCLHTNMDLYKWAYKSMPWIGSDLLMETFLLALEIRKIDMRASPYDLTSYHLPPIKIETPEGKTEYEHHQRQLSQKARPVRKKLMKSLSHVLKPQQPT